MVLEMMLIHEAVCVAMFPGGLRTSLENVLCMSSFL